MGREKQRPPTAFVAGGLGSKGSQEAKKKAQNAFAIVKARARRKISRGAVTRRAARRKSGGCCFSLRLLGPVSSI